MSMTMPMGRVPVSTRRAAVIQILLQVLHTRPVLLHYLLDMGDAVEIHLELVQLPQDRRVARNLLVGTVNYVARAVVLHLCEHLRLLAEVLDILLNVGHEPVEVAPQRGQGRAVKKQKTLAARPAGSARAAGASIECGLALSQELDLLDGQTQLRVRHGVGRHCGKGAARRGALEREMSRYRRRLGAKDDDGLDGDGELG